MSTLIISPIFYETSGGAAVYYQKLTKNLISCGEDITIISEFCSQIPRKKIDKSNFKYIGLFPNWASKSRNYFRDYIFFTLQNLLYFLLLFYIFTIKPKNVIIHSSFYNKPGIFFFITWLCFLIFKKTNFILDVRDRLLPQSKKFRFCKYKTIIACSISVCDHLVKLGINKSKINLINVLQEKIYINKLDEKKILDKYSFTKKKYIICVGAIKEDKNTVILLETLLTYLIKKMDNYFLLLVGPLKTNSKRVIKMLNHEKVIFFDTLNNDEILILINNCSLSINPSVNEGMPRSCLEAIELNVPVLLPPNIPEFNSFSYEN